MKNLINIVLIAVVLLLIFNSDKIFSYTYNYFFNSSPDKLLCVPNNEKRDYNTITNKYVKKHFSHDLDLLISLKENKLTIHYQNGNEDIPRVKTNIENDARVMGFYKNRREYIFLRMSGRLIYKLYGGLYGIDEDIRTETYYVCSKFKKNLF